LSRISSFVVLVAPKTTVAVVSQSLRRRAQFHRGRPRSAFFLFQQPVTAFTLKLCDQR
jgi:hypothetical protein